MFALITVILYSGQIFRFPDLAESMVKLMIGLAPVSVVSEMTSPIKYVVIVTFCCRVKFKFSTNPGCPEKW